MLQLAKLVPRSRKQARKRGCSSQNPLDADINPGLVTQMRFEATTTKVFIIIWRHIHAPPHGMMSHVTIKFLWVDFTENETMYQKLHSVT